jgi:hypothetical protein
VTTTEVQMDPAPQPNNPNDSTTVPDTLPAPDPFYGDFDPDLFGPSSFDFLFTADTTFQA